MTDIEKARKSRHKIGDRMIDVVLYVGEHPGANKSEVAEHIKTNRDRPMQHGMGPVDRAGEPKYGLIEILLRKDRRRREYELYLTARGELVRKKALEIAKLKALDKPYKPITWADLIADPSEADDEPVALDEDDGSN